MAALPRILLYSMTIITILTLPPALQAQAGWDGDEDIPGDGQRYDYVWSMTEVVSTESDHGCIWSSLVVGGDGMLHVVWRDATNFDWDIYYKNKPIMAILPEGAGGNWSYYEEVSTESTESSSEPSLAIDEDGTIHVAWQDSTNYAGSNRDIDVFYKKKPAWGTWSITEVVSTESRGGSVAPSLGIAGDGTLHVAWADSTDYSGAGTDSDIFYKNKTADGNWTTTEIVSAESTEDAGAPSLFVEMDGTVHIVWHDSTDLAGAGSDKDIFYRRRSSGGSWSDIELVSKESTETSEKPSLAVDRDGTIHCAWEDETFIPNAGTDYDIFYKKKPSSADWSPVEIVSIWSIYDSSNCSIVMDRRRTGHVAWEEVTYNPPSSDIDVDIYYSQKPRGGSWTFREIVSTESDDDSWRPFLAVDMYGTVHVVWEDFTNYMGCGPKRDIFYKKKTRIGNIEVRPGHWLEEAPSESARIQN